MTKIVINGQFKDCIEWILHCKNTIKNPIVNETWDYYIDNGEMTLEELSELTKRAVSYTIEDNLLILKIKCTEDEIIKRKADAVRDHECRLEQYTGRLLGWCANDTDRLQIFTYLEHMRHLDLLSELKSRISTENK